METTVGNTEEIVIEQPKTKRGTRLRGGGSRGRGPRGPNNGGGGNNGGPGGGGDKGPGRDQHWTPERYRIGIWVAIASIVMLFTALTSAYVVRSGLPGSTDWRPVSMPSLVWLSTALILASSFTISKARKSLRIEDAGGYKRWLGVTLALGLGFVASQLLAWRQLVRQGLYLASNPHSSFFFILTGLHGVHIFGGILALAFVLLRAWQKRSDLIVTDAKRQAAIDAVATYWHFMDGLWIYLLLLLILWR